MQDLWEKLHKVRPDLVKSNEYLCPVCLVKRFYPRYLKKKRSKDNFLWFLNPVPEIESVSEVALRAKGKEKCGITWGEVCSQLKSAFGDIPEMEEDEFSFKVEGENTEESATEVKDVREYLSEYKKLIGEILGPVQPRGRSLFNSELLYEENLRSPEVFLRTMGMSEREVSVPEDKLEKAREALLKLYRILGEPPKSYAVLMMDGDNMGAVLMGDAMKTVDNYLHPGIFGHLQPEVEEKAQATKRLVTASTHAAISKALKNFSVRFVPQAVERGSGTLIYTGGDDVLALLPKDTALDTAADLAETFSKSWEGWDLLPGGSLSAGLLIVRYKHPLYDVMDRVRDLEKKAKALGRNAIAVGLLKGSGAYYEAVLNWDGVSDARRLAKSISKESKRLLYHLDEIRSLPNGEGAIRAFLKYETERHLQRDLSDILVSHARHFRVHLKDEEIEPLKIDRRAIGSVSGIANRLIGEGHLTPGTLVDKLKLSDLNTARELYALILKKQISGLISFLRIVLDVEGKGDAT